MATYAYSPQVIYRGFNENGLPLVGGKLYTYVAGTTTPLATKSDFSGTDNANPVTLDARGEAVVILDTSKAYKFVLKTSTGVPVGQSADNITASGGSGGITGSDGKVKISNTDPIANYLNTKVLGTGNVGVTIVPDVAGDYLLISSTDSKVSTTGADSPAYLQDKIEGSGSIGTSVVSGKVRISSQDKVKVSATDTADYLASKIIAGTNVTVDVTPNDITINAIAGAINDIVDTFSVDLTSTLGVLTADVNISPDVTNLTSIVPGDGVYTGVTTGIGSPSGGDTYAGAGSDGNGTVANPISSFLNNEAANSLVGVTNLGAHGALGSTTVASGAGYTNRMSFGRLVNTAYTSVNCPASAAIGTYNYAQVYIDPANVVQYQNGPLTQLQKDANCIQLFAYTSADSTTVTGVNHNTKYSGYNPESLMRDLFEQIGNPKSGLTLKAGAATQNLGITAGKFVAMGINDVSGESKIAKTVTGTTAATLYMMTSTTLELTPLTNLTTTFYNPTGSTKTTVGNGNWTNLRVYGIFDETAPDQMTILVQYGPAQYATKNAAVNGFSTESFTPNPNTAALYYLGYVTIEKNGLSINADFASSTKWQDGAVSGSAAGSTVTYYEFTTTTTSGDVIITHNLNKQYPLVAILDTTTNANVSTGITYSSLTQLTVNFPVAYAVGQYIIRVTI